MPMDAHNVRLRFLAKYGDCNMDDITIAVSTFLEEYQNCDWDEIPIMIPDYLRQEVCNCPNVVVNDETDDDDEENEVNYYHHEVSQFVLQDSNMIEHEMIINSDFEDDESIEYIDDYSNDYVPRSFEFVIDDSEDEEEEYYQFDNYLQRTTQAVLQESDSFEHESMEDSAKSGSSNSDFEESMEEIVQESEINLDLEAEKSVVTTSSLEEEEPNVACEGSNDINGHDDIIKELQEVLGISDQKLDEVVESGVGEYPILEAELEKLYQADGKHTQADGKHTLAEVVGGDLDDSTITESKSGLMSKYFPCNCEDDFVLVKEPKPPDPFIPDLQDLSIVKDVNESKIDMELGICRKGELNKSLKFYRNLAYCNLLNNFGNMKVTGNMFLVVKIKKCTWRKCTVILMKNMSHEHYWVFGIMVWEKYYLNRKTKENFLSIEYEWKGIEVLIYDPP